MSHDLLLLDSSKRMILCDSWQRDGGFWYTFLKLKSALHNTNRFRKAGADALSFFNGLLNSIVDPRKLEHQLRRHRFPFVVVWSKPGPGAEIGGAFAAEITEAESKALAMG
jgi:hypothetical protein